MLKSPFSSFCRSLQETCTFISLILNVFLIFLIIRKSSKKIGNYKYLMIYICVFEILYTILGMLTKPVSKKKASFNQVIQYVHSYSSRVIVIVDVKNSMFSREVNKILNSKWLICQESCQFCRSDMRILRMLRIDFCNSLHVSIRVFGQVCLLHDFEFLVPFQNLSQILRWLENDLLVFCPDKLWSCVGTHYAFYFRRGKSFHRVHKVNIQLLKIGNYSVSGKTSGICSSCQLKTSFTLDLIIIHRTSLGSTR